MALYYASINSGSNGNAYYVGNARHAVLIDAGLACRTMEARLQELGLDVKKLRAIFISHEHSDHIRGVNVFAKKHALPVYISGGSYRGSSIQLPTSQLHIIKGEGSIGIADLQIHFFSKSHDAQEPHSFTISHLHTTVGVFTDIGQPCKQVQVHFHQCHAAFLESNYDEDMLQNGSYPFVLKKRISSAIGHLSNTQALELFLHHASPGLQHLVLSHLSKENNSPAAAAATFAPHSHRTKITVASRERASELFFVSATHLQKTAKPVGKQITLFS